mgnify:CR=1 FL=1
MEFNLSQLLNVIFDWIPNSHGFETKIEPILIKNIFDDNFSKETLLNRFAYTIVDQQRDVESVIIPLWNTMLYYGMNSQFLLESPLATEFISSCLQAFGHQQYHTKEELDLQDKSLGSRTDALLNCYRKRSPEAFFNLIINNKDNLLELYKQLTDYYFVSDKSAAFFLRDLLGIDFSLVPIDSNVARSVQRIGLYFVNQSDQIPDFNKILNQIIPIKKRTNPDNFRDLSNNIFKVCEVMGVSNYSPYKLNRYLFVIGADYCQNDKCGKCKIKELCYFNNLDSSRQSKFKDKLKS